LRSSWIRQALEALRWEIVKGDEPLNRMGLGCTASGWVQAGNLQALTPEFAQKPMYSAIFY
jgi:hypothetical protein